MSFYFKAPDFSEGGLWLPKSEEEGSDRWEGEGCALLYYILCAACF